MYKDLFHKNVQAEINQTFKNILRTYPGGESVKNALFCSLAFIYLFIFFFLSGINEGKRKVKL